MYRLDWIEQLKLKLIQAPSGRGVAQISPVVWSLGWTSLLTDISTEMVNSALPVYLVLHLHLSPMQFGVIDGVYNGLAIALLSIIAGLAADRWSRHKEVAGFGYVLSAACKLLLLAAGGAWVWIAAVVGLDRAGKGIRSAPRDAIISFNTPPRLIASAFALHRGLDAGGALLGPVVAFILLAQVPGAFDVLWMTSFVFGVLGVAVITLFVPGSRSARATAAREQSEAASAQSAPAPVETSHSTKAAFKLLRTRSFGTVTVFAALLAMCTVSDGFIYLLLQERTKTAASFVPLFYVGTACFYMLFSVPAGALADRIGHRSVLLGGYGVLALVYVALLSATNTGWPVAIGCVALMGIYYAATEGILMAMTTTIVPTSLRTSGLAIVGTALGLGKMVSSVVFGWLWTTVGQMTAIVCFIVALAMIIGVGSMILKGVLKVERNVAEAV